MPNNTVQSKDTSIAGLFNDFYVVPDYQREFVWEDDEVQQLLDDVHKAFESGSPTDQSLADYFIGSIVVCPRKDAEGVYELIDGQQRLTTIFLTICALRDYFRTTESKEIPDDLKLMLQATSTDSEGNPHFRIKLDLQYEDSKEILRLIVESDPSIDETPINSSSVKNILEAYQTIKTFFGSNGFRNNEIMCRKFYGYLINKVKLIQITTDDVTRALKVFETINQRGVGLDSLDLLKNLLFMNTEPAEFEKLKVSWEKMKNKLFSIRERPLRFLRYNILSQYDLGNRNYRLTENEVYEWFADPQNYQVSDRKHQPIAFVDELLDDCERYSRVWHECKTESGELSPTLVGLKALTGSSARQHLILLLSARNMQNASDFDILVREVENILFCYFLVQERSQNVERNFSIWASQISQITSGAQLESFLSDKLRPARNALYDRFNVAFRNLQEGNVPKYRLKYILARLAQFVNSAAYPSEPSQVDIQTYLGNGYEIEHIFPQTPSSESAEEYGVYEDVDISRISNLLLLEKSLNASCGNKPFSKKRQIYGQSKILLTSCISGTLATGGDTKIDKAVRELRTYDLWNRQAQDRRTNEILNIAQKVWNIRSNAS